MAFNSITSDARRGMRALRTSPTHTLVAALTIALGIGLTTTMFTIVQAVLLRPLPFPGSEGLVAINADFPGLSLRNIGFSPQEIDDLSARADLFEAVAPVWVFDANLTGAQRPERVVMIATSGRYFQVLGAGAQRGRVLGPADQVDGFAEGVVLSDAAWHRLFGGDETAIGRQIRIDTDLYTIVGIMPPDFRHPAAAPAPDVDVWSVAGFRANPFPSPPARNRRMLPSAIARLTPHVSVADAAAAVDALSANLRRDYPGDYPPDGRWSLRVEPLRTIVVGNVRPLLLAFSGAVVLVLLIACANVSNLLLARATTRQREVAIQLAIGASRGRIVQQLLTEVLLLAAIGGAIGVVVSFWLQSLLVGAMPADLPRLQEIRGDWTTVAFAFGVIVLASAVCGIVPALHAARGGPSSVLADIGRGTTASPRQRRLRTGFVIAEIAMSMLLVAGAGLLVATVSRLLAVDPGFDHARVATARTWIAVPNNPALDPYRTAGARAELARRLVERLRQSPDVSMAALGTAVPLSQQLLRVPILIDGATLTGDAASAEIVSVTPDYFAVLGIPLSRGRTFADTDDASTAPVVVIDEEAERRFFSGADAVGRRLRIGRAGPQGLPPAATVVGVVKTVKHNHLDEEAAPHVYASLYQRSGRSISLLVKTRVDERGAQEHLRQAVAAVDADLPVFAVEPLAETIGRSIAKQRFSANAVTAFAILALLLVIGGVYGVMAYAVSARTKEVGVRIAMGASPAAVLRGVLLEALRASLAGVGIGVVLAAVGTRFIRTMLFGVSSTDPRIMLAAAVVMVSAALVASYLPARRAARIDPAVSLRCD